MYVVNVTHIFPPGIMYYVGHVRRYLMYTCVLLPRSDSLSAEKDWIPENTCTM